ncbi:archaeal proteasome endopeptidase complex subunit alpha [Candidatus Pacearchaeota archaeon]|nr:archaeal proteasome endopeptidase complex subunit alpha [Candidatus Pacearchaeota archaeon]
MPIEMQHQAMGYDRTATMFSPDGHLLQVEYAEKTVRLGSNSIGIACKDGVVFVADKRIKDRLFSSESMSKIHEVDEHIIAATAGILSDARILMERAQLISQQHKVTYDTEIEVESVVRELANIKQYFTQFGGVRPFGVSIMVGGITNKIPKLYVSDVTGNYFSFKASAIGENDEKIKEALRKDYHEDMTIDDAVKMSLKIFKELLGKNFDISRFEVGYIKNDEKKITKIYEDSLKKYIK